MAATVYNVLIFTIMSLSTIKSVMSIKCYDCSGTDSNNPFRCNEYLDSNTDLVVSNCSDIHNAQFCIKQVGRYEGHTIECYQCSSTETMECGDGLMHLDNGIFKPKSCEHVYNAQYCIKVTGGIATKRYCSSVDLGNQCNYVQQPGDKLEYRTCIYTCSTDGCNGASNTVLSVTPVITGLILLFSNCI